MVVDVDPSQEPTTAVPSTMSVDLAVMTAPLWMPSPNWSSRSIAAELGVSQSFVARLWRAAPAQPRIAAQLDRLLTERPMTLLGMLVAAEGSCILLGPVAFQSPQPHTPLPPRAARRLRTVLAADLVRPTRGDSQVDDFWRIAGGGGRPASSVVALTSGDLDVPGAVTGTRVTTAGHGWQELGGSLGRLSAPATADPLVELESRLRRWYTDRAGPFIWLSDGATGRSRSSLAATSGQRTGRDRALGDDILGVVRDGLADGTFTGGEEISERAIAHRLHIGRVRVRNALRQLADDGLIAATPHGAMAVRLPAVVDIVELYVARRALGAIALRAASRWTAEGRHEVAQLLEQLQNCADRGDVDRAQAIDLAFQNALARASGLIRIPGMLESLAQQLLMYISVLGVRYSFPPARIAGVDTALFRAVDAKDHDQAVRIWQEKMDDGQRYMLEQTDLLFGRGRR